MRKKCFQLPCSNSILIKNGIIFSVYQKNIFPRPDFKKCRGVGMLKWFMRPSGSIFSLVWLENGVFKKYFFIYAPV